jgi:hypothetical protein
MIVCVIVCLYIFGWFGMTICYSCVMVTNRKIYKGYFIKIIMKNTGTLVGELKRISVDFDETARRAVKSDESVHIPANLPVSGLNQLINRPQDLDSSNDGSEPCYASLDEANAGRNNDGSNHAGYVTIDPIAGNVTGLVNRDGSSRITARRGLVKYLSGHDARVGLSTNLNLLAEEKGNYVVVESDNDKRVSLYASSRCRCPCLDADIFWPEEFAENVADELQDSVHNSGSVYTAAEIDDNFLIEWGLLRKGYSLMTVSIMSGNFEEGSDPVAFVAKYADRK